MALQVALQSCDQRLCWPFEEPFLLQQQVPGLANRMVLHPQQQLIIANPANHNRFLRHTPLGLAKHEGRDLFLRVKKELTRIAVPIAVEVRHIVGANLIVFTHYPLQLAFQRDEVHGFGPEGTAEGGIGRILEEDVAAECHVLERRHEELRGLSGLLLLRSQQQQNRLILLLPRRGLDLHLHHIPMNLQPSPRSLFLPLFPPHSKCLLDLHRLPRELPLGPPADNLHYLIFNDITSNHKNGSLLLDDREALLNESFDQPLLYEAAAVLLKLDDAAELV